MTRQGSLRTPTDPYPTHPPAPAKESPPRPRGIALNPIRPKGRWSLTALLVLAPAILVQACTSRDVVGVGVGSVTVQPATATILSGDSVQFNAVVRGEDGDAISAANVVWTASPDSSVEVTPDGVVVARRPGPARVTATFNDVAGSAQITVIFGPSVEPSRPSLAFRLDRDASARPPQSIDLRTAGGGTVVGLSADVAYEPGPSGWLDVALAGTAPPTTLTTTPTTSGLPNGRYGATVLITSTTSPKDTVEIPVTLSLASVGVTETGGSTIVDERGSSDQFSVVLGLRPESDVVLDVVSDDTGEAVVSPATLVFTPANWAEPQSVTVTGVGDDESDGTRNTVVRVSVDDAASDPAYEPVVARTVTVQTRDAVGVSVTTTGGQTQAVEGGANDTFEVSLDLEPSRDVILRLAVDDPADARVQPATLTFSPSNWNTPRTVTFSAVDDAIADGTRARTITLSVDPASDTVYAGRPPLTISASTRDNEVPSFSLSHTGGSTRPVEGGKPDTVLVRLGVQPLTAVVFDVSIDDRRDAGVSPTALVFTSGNWNVPQPIVVTAVDDPDNDGDQTRTIQVAVNPASDGVFRSLATRSITATTIDDEVAAFIVTPTGPNTVSTEGAAPDSISVVLGARAPSDVVIDVRVDDPDDATVTPSRLTFSPDGWDVPQWVVFRAVDDDVVDGAQDREITFSVHESSHASYRDLPDQTLLAFTADNDGASITITETGDTTIVTEAGSDDTFRVRLDTRPLTAVVMEITNPDPTEASVSPTTLTFPPESWSEPQTVTVVGVDDDEGDGDQNTPLRIEVREDSDAAFRVLDPMQVNVTTTDDDAVGIEILESGGTRVSEDGSLVDVIEVRLLARPDEQVVLAVEADDETEVGVGPATLAFTSSDWSTPKAVAVSGVDDDFVDGDVVSSVRVRIAPANVDAKYDTVTARTVNVVTEDDERAGFTVTQTGSGTSVDESGSRDTIRVVLDARPQSNVEIEIDRDPAGELDLGRSSMDFTPSNWDQPQLLVVEGRNDDFVDGDQITQVRFSVERRSDDHFEDLPDTFVDVTTRDDDEAGFRIIETGGSTTVEEDGSDDEIRLVLTGRPTTAVTLLISSGDPGEVDVDPVEVRFSSRNWDDERRIDIDAVDDPFADGDKLTNITVAVEAATSNEAFRDLAPQSVEVRVLDDEDVGFRLRDEDGLEIEEGSTGTFEIRLEDTPETPVRLRIRSSAPDVVQPQVSEVQFTDREWREVTLIAAGDDDGTATITVEVIDEASDPAFSDVPSRSFDVRVTDGDVDDLGDFTLAGADGLSVDEGASTSFSVVLDQRPGRFQFVVLRVQSEAPAIASVDPGTVWFNADNWDDPRSIRVEGVRDGASAGDRETEVTLGVIDFASDARFRAARDQSVRVVVRDVAGAAEVSEAGPGPF